MIRRVAFKNFKALREIVLPLERFTVLVGQNGAGKTSVLEGLGILTRVAKSDPRDVFQGSAEVGVIASRGATGSLELSMTGDWGQQACALAIRFEGIEDYPFTDTFVLESRAGDTVTQVRHELGARRDANKPLTGALAELVPRAELLRFEAHHLAEAVDATGTIDLGPDGVGLAGVVMDLATSQPDAFLKLQDALRAVIPGLVRVRHVRREMPLPSVPPRAFGDATPPASEPPRSSSGRWGHQLVFDMAGASDVPARAVGEGTLLVLGVLASLLRADRPSLVMFDHLERALTPGATRRFVEQLQLVLAEEPDLQLVVTSGSPHAIDALGADAVRIATLRPDGSAAWAKLVDHPDYALLREDLRPGEFWSTVGESWVAGVPPFRGTIPPPRG